MDDFRKSLPNKINANYRRIKNQEDYEYILNKNKYSYKGLLGCTYDMLYKYLLKTYEEYYGEQWDFKQKVHIDHIKPVTLWIPSVNDELWHFSNLRLLKAEDNLVKLYKDNLSKEDLNELKIICENKKQWKLHKKEIMEKSRKQILEAKVSNNDK